MSRSPVGVGGGEPRAQLLSVVVPTKDRQARLERFLRSVRQQTIDGVEIVVVDDGSKEPVRDLGADARCVRHEISRGACAARNTGLRHSRGRYVAFFDDDTELCEPTALASAIRWFERVPRCEAVGFRQIDASGRTRGANPADSSSACAANRFYSHGCVIARQALEALGGFREIFGYYYEEIELSLRLIDRDAVIVYDPALTVIHHEDQIGRDWLRISRLSTRNALLTVALDYPPLLVPVGVGRAVWNSIRAFRSRIGIDPLGKLAAVMGAVQLLPTALAHRSPLRVSTLFKYRALGRRAVALDDLAPPARRE
jgi:glycosyltransferase involved in cell wall biosynthesis